VTKTQAVEHLIVAIREVCAGVHLSPSVSGAVVQAYLARSDTPFDPLTDRERQVLQLVAEGNTTNRNSLARKHTGLTEDVLGDIPGADTDTASTL